MSVAERFLVDIPDTDTELRENIAQHMAFAHLSVAQSSKEYVVSVHASLSGSLLKNSTSASAPACRYLESMRRYNYTTPKSYLELISLYKSLLAQKRAELRADKERLENGVGKIAQASAQVFNLQQLGNRDCAHLGMRFP